MAALTALPTLERLSSRVVRVLGLNPGHMTLQGTNTYLVGKGQQKILIDTGEGKQDYPALLNKSLEGCEIKHVVLTHWHHDHVGGVSQVSKLQPNAAFWKMTCIEHDKQFTVSEGGRERVVEIKPLVDSDMLRVDDDDDTSLKVVHTPGHTTDHVSLYLEQEKAVFSGDCVLGGSTAVFENLYDYMKSLSKLIDLQPGRIYPGHGPVIENGNEMLTNYVAHRNQREAQILECIRSKAQPWTSMDIVKVVYAAVPVNVHPAADKNVTQHLLKLEQQGDIVRADNEHWRSKI